MFGCPIRIAPEADSAYGAALLGFVGLGWIPELTAAAADSLRNASKLHPEPTASRRYTGGFLAYRAIHERMRDVYHDEAGVPDV